MNRSSRLTAEKLGLLGSLYLAQGLPFGFFTQALPVLMRKQGYSLEAIGLTTMLALPWALKFLWAPLLDRAGAGRLGRRRSWILPLQALTALLLATIAAVPGDKAMTMLLATVFVVNLLSATQDIATDGLAVDMLEPAERGLANGIQVAGYRLGMIVGGGALLIFYDRLGWAGTFGAMAVIILASTLPILLHREAPARGSSPGDPPSIMGFLRRPGILRVAALIFVYKLGDAFATGMLRPFLADVGLDLAEVGWLLGTVGFVSGLVGALLGGALVRPLGRRRALVGFATLQALTVGGYAFLAVDHPGRSALYLLCSLEHLAGGMATAALFTCMMDWCRPGSSATDYTVQASLVVLATGLASALSGFSAGALGYPTHFLLATGLAALSVLVTARLFPARETALPEGSPG